MIIIYKQTFWDVKMILASIKSTLNRFILKIFTTVMHLRVKIMGRYFYQLSSYHKRIYKIIIYLINVALKFNLVASTLIIMVYNLEIFP